MADKKISALTGASTPLAGTEVLPIVQSGATVKVSVANLTAGRAVATAGGSFTDNITQSTAAKGINFTANSTGSGTMTSQLLNWYEEGTWSVGVAGSTTAGTYNGLINYATYTRIGRQVTANFYVRWDTGTGTGNLLITGLPFTSRNASGYYYSGSVSNTNAAYTSGNTVSLFLAHNTTNIELVQISGTAGQSNVPYDADALVIGQITYFV